MNIAELEKQVTVIANAVDALQKILKDNTGKGSAKTHGKTPNSYISSTFLVRRKQVLAALGIERPVSRKSWSHEQFDEAIVFDAWQHAWTTDSNGKLDRYPMRTTQYDLYSLQHLKDDPRPGHVRWQHHVDMVLAGKRKAIAIVPVAKAPGSKPNKGTKGWLPQYVMGKIHEDSPGNYYFHAEKIVPM